ncbi:retrovirus-related Pol polyprotein from transposon 17.6 [Trichonephila clavipes]|nr:retrovirus-related Pol polyprotein from transposon 17.6 [Trichonephila clavipes]
MSPRQIEILKSEVNKMLELKIIEPGESDFTSPLILVEAQGKEARPCIDYRRLNKVTRTQFFPLPNIEELLEKVSAAKYISILDLTRGRLMANLLRNCEDFAVPYLDDIAIFSLAWDDHLKHLKDVFDRLRSAKLHIKPSKLIAAPLTDLLKGRNRKSTVDWNSSCQNAFEELKTRLSKNPVLYSPDFTKSFVIQCDASNLGIGVVLSQFSNATGVHGLFFRPKNLLRSPSLIPDPLVPRLSPCLSLSELSLSPKKLFSPPGRVHDTPLVPSHFQVTKASPWPWASVVSYSCGTHKYTPGRLEPNGARILVQHLDTLVHHTPLFLKASLLTSAEVTVFFLDRLRLLSTGAGTS